MKQIISFSLWGNKPIYNIGAIKNLDLAKTIYKGWEVIFYYNETVPISTILTLKNNGAILIKADDDLHGMFWRFLAADLPYCEYAIFRDTDSRLSMREKMAVDEWIISGKILHVMRDHPFHKIPFGANQLSILGGMWGIKGGQFPMSESINKFKLNKKFVYGSDQTFLTVIYSHFKNSRITHDEFFSGLRFPIKREKYSFIGERINEYEVPIGNDREVLLRFYEQKYTYLKICNKLKKCFLASHYKKMISRCLIVKHK